MKVIGLDGRVHQLTLPLNERNRKRDCSEPHERARRLLHRLFSCDRIHEELYLPGSGGLYLDFLLLSRKMAVEVHGEQHYSFVPFFHHSIQGFIESKQKDANKRSWCELNNIKLIELKHDQSDEQWESIIVGEGTAGTT